jgi:hypothetical protein
LKRGFTEGTQPILKAQHAEVVHAARGKLDRKQISIGFLANHRTSFAVAGQKAVTVDSVVGNPIGTVVVRTRSEISHPNPILSGLETGDLAILPTQITGRSHFHAHNTRGIRFHQRRTECRWGASGHNVIDRLLGLAARDLGKLGFPEELARSPEAGLARIVAITAAFGWTTVARLVRAATLSLKTRDFVRAAIALGASPWRVMLVHILPNALSPILVATALAVGEVIKFESVLSFLGLGIQPPTPSWGNMLTNAQELIWTAPHLALWPGLLILATVASCNILADALADRFSPRGGARPSS